MVRNQFSTLRQTHGIDTVRFEHDNSKRYAQTDTIISGRNKPYPPVSSAIRKTPVKGACMTPDINPAIPIRAKFFSGMYVPPNWNSLHT